MAIVDGSTAILEAAGLNGVCTDENLTVVKAFGNTKNYLKDENFISDLCELLPDDVSVIVKAAAHEALKSNKRVTLGELNFGREPSVNIVITPFFGGDAAGLQLLILFTSNKRKSNHSSLNTPGDLQLLTRQHLTSLEQELAEAKNNLQEAYGAINSSNENVQSLPETFLAIVMEMQPRNNKAFILHEVLQMEKVIKVNLPPLKISRPAAKRKIGFFDGRKDPN